jgi:hypothetical protein
MATLPNRFLVMSSGCTAFASDLGHVFTVLADRLSTFAPDLGHVLAVLANHLTASAPGFARFVRVEFVSRAVFVSRPTALACNLPLLVFVH